MKLARVLSILAMCVALLAYVYWQGWFVAPAASTRGSGPEVVAKFADYWDQALKSNVKDGHVDYKNFRRSQSELAKHMTALEGIAPEELGKDSALLGFWIDYYNARVVHEVLAGQSPSTPVGRSRLFALTRFYVAGQRMSLTDVETSIRNRFQEPRIHFAVNCASFSCPALRSESYIKAAPRMSEVLDEQARGFLSDPTKNRFDVGNHKAYLSQIFQWYAKDFEVNGTLQAHLAPFAPPEVSKLLEKNQLVVEYIPYDWNSNGHF